MAVFATRVPVPIRPTPLPVRPPLDARTLRLKALVTVAVNVGSAA